MPRDRAELRRFGVFLGAVTVLNVLFNLRFPSGELHFWYVLPSTDVVMVLVALLLLGLQGWRVPKGVAIFFAVFVLFVRIVRFGDGIEDHFYAQRFTLYDLPLFPEGVRFAHSALPWWKFYPLVVGFVALVVIIPVAAYYSLRVAESYLTDWKRAPLCALLVLMVYPIGLELPRKPTHRALFMGGFGASIGPRLRREFTFLTTVVGARGQWAEAIEATRAELAKTPSNLAKLKRRNVHLILVESYGEVVVERPDFVKAITPTFDSLESELGARGYTFASGRIVSSTFGGRSWLAQATLATGVATTDQLGFDTVTAFKPKVLSGYFRDAGYRTVLAAPGVVRAGTKGDLYRFDRTYHYSDFGYEGPAFAWATMPDQYVFDFVRRRELGKTTRPLFIQYILVSSHAPWSETPTIVEDWSRLGNGGLFDTQPVLRFPIVWPNFQHAHEAYIRSIVYDFEIIKRYVERFLDDDSLVIVLGDHQPVVEVSGSESQRAVPVHVFSKSRDLVEPYLARGYVPGMWPHGKTPPRGLEHFLPDLLRDFSTAPSR